MENEDRMIFLNEPEKVDGLYPRDKTMEYKLKLEFEKAAKTGHPKIVSFNEAREANILSNTNFYHLENEGGKMMHTLEAYGWAWLDRAWQSSVPDFKIDGYNFYVETRRCFKLGNALDAVISMYYENQDFIQKLCFEDGYGKGFENCYNIKNIYSSILEEPNMVALTRDGKMKKTDLILRETLLELPISTY